MSIDILDHDKKKLEQTKVYSVKIPLPSITGESETKMANINESVLTICSRYSNSIQTCQISIKGFSKQYKQHLEKSNGINYSEDEELIDVLQELLDIFRATILCTMSGMELHFIKKITPKQTKIEKPMLVVAR